MLHLFAKVTVNYADESESTKTYRNTSLGWLEDEVARLVDNDEVSGFVIVVAKPQGLTKS